MKLLTQRGLINNIVSEYRKHNSHRFDRQPEYQKIYNQLIILGKNKTAEQIVAVTGSDKWVLYLCDNCGEWVTEVVEFDNAQRYCERCLRAAVDIFNTANLQPD